MADLDIDAAEKAIRANRDATNALIRAHDAEGFRDYVLPDVTLVNGGGEAVFGADACIAALAGYFAEEGFIAYVRTPTRITIGEDGMLASEYGDWQGEWTEADGRRWGGHYSAMWRLKDGKWWLQAELYVLLRF